MLRLAGAALMCTVGFAVAATWIAFVANELVAMLQFFGRLSGVSSAVLGLTVLAWGNSVGDLSTNIAMAKRCGAVGHGERCRCPSPLAAA